jgi:hypothetical protein
MLCFPRKSAVTLLGVLHRTALMIASNVDRSRFHPEKCKMVGKHIAYLLTYMYCSTRDHEYSGSYA